MSARRILHPSRTLLASARHRSITHDVTCSLGVLPTNSYNSHLRPKFTRVSNNGLQAVRGISTSFPVHIEKEPAAEGEDDDPCPEWQNPLHHNNPEFQKILTEDFASGDEMPAVPLPPFSSPDGGIDAPPHIHELAEQIIHLNMIELKSLMDRIGNHYGFEEGGGYDDSDEGGAEEGGGAEVKEEKTTWDLRLDGFDAKSKIKVIKEIRTVTGLGLKEAKELVEGAPTSVKKDIKMEEAEELKAKLEAAGASVSIA